MKKYLFILLLFCVCHMSSAQNVDRIFDEFKSEKNAECVKVPRFVIFLGSIFAGQEDEDAWILKKIKSIRVLTLDDCQTNVKERFHQEVYKLFLNGYDELIRVNDKGEKVLVLMKMKKKTICELLLVCAEKEDCTTVQINGRFAQNDIDKLLAWGTEKKYGRY